MDKKTENKWIRNWKKLIPTWFICLWFLLWIYPVAFFIGITLLVIQIIQRKKLFSEMHTKEEIESLEEEIHTLNTLIDRKNTLIKDQEEELEQYVDYVNNLKATEIVHIREKIRNLEDEKNTLLEELNNKKEVIKRMEHGMYERISERYDNLCTKYNTIYTDISEKEKKGKEVDKQYELKIKQLEIEYEKTEKELSINFENKKRQLETEYENKENELYIKYENKEKELYTEYENKEKELCAEYENKKNYTTESINHLQEEEKTFKDKLEWYKSEIEKEKTDFDTYKRKINLEKSSFQNEILSIKEETKILNTELISKYYIFSDYTTFTSEDCKNNLTIIKQKEKELREQEKDVEIAPWYNFSKKTKEKCIRQILRTFNAECDNICSDISLKNIDRARRQIENSFTSLNKLYESDGISIRRNLLQLKLKQASLLFTYKLKYNEEREVQRAVREQMIEEAKAQRELEEQKKMVEKDLQQHIGEVNRLIKYMRKTQIDAEKELYIEKIKELEEKIKQLESKRENVIQREENAKAGFVYIISNIGSFGENIYKIGMTRRLEPMERIKELSSASVPFEFDVHAMIFSSDAPELENTLHKHFSHKAVNKVNPRKEFYRIDIDEIEKVVKENYNEAVVFTKIPLAEEYRQTLYIESTTQ